jgi:putative protease
MPEIEIGTVTHYFDKIGVAAIRIDNGELAVGDTVHIVGHTTNVTVTIESMQIEHNKVQKAGAGQIIGAKVSQKVREHDKVFKVVP